MKILAVALPLPAGALGERTRGRRRGRGGGGDSTPATTGQAGQRTITAGSAARSRETVFGKRSKTTPLDVADLYRRYGDMVYGRCLTMLRNEADAVDATQEVFIKAHRYAHKFEGRSKPSTWLYRIATNHCLNVIRSRKRRPEDPVEEIEDHRPASHREAVGDSVLDRIAGSQLVQVLLEGWDERTQQCVVYHYLDGMTHAEVGELLGISGAAVRKRLAKFRAESKKRHPAWAGWNNPASSSEEP